MSADYQVTLDVTVFDPVALREAAKVEALKVMSAEAWDDLRSSNASVVAADLHMLLDPGVSPAGTEITHGEVQWLSGDPQDEETEEVVSA